MSNCRSQRFLSRDWFKRHLDIIPQICTSVNSHRNASEKTVPVQNISQLFLSNTELFYDKALIWLSYSHTKCIFFDIHSGLRGKTYTELTLKDNFRIFKETARDKTFWNWSSIHRWRLTQPLAPFSLNRALCSVNICPLKQLFLSLTGSDCTNKGHKTDCRGVCVCEWLWCGCGYFHFRLVAGYTLYFTDIYY